MSIRCCLLAAGLFVCASAAVYSPFTWNSTVVGLSKNTIDFRYLNYIVDPLVDCPHCITSLVDCPHEGVFPHPHDCTWYYRCHDRYNFTETGISGMYWRSYYQCEPGTEFLDSLDQCVFKGGARNCKKEDKKEVVCRTRLDRCFTGDHCDPSIEGSAALKKLEVCEEATKECPGKSEEELCSRGNFYDRKNDKCIKLSLIDNCGGSKHQGDFSKQDILCLDVMESCIDMDVCRKGGKRQTERLCELKRKCHGPNKRITEQNLCPASQMFNALINKCVITPEAEDACTGGPATGKKPVGCTKQIEKCSIKPDCDSKLSTLVCTGVFVCGNHAPRSSLCPPGEFYLPSLDRCTSADQASLFRQSVDCVTTDIPPKPYIDQYVCKAGDYTSIPWAEGHPDLKCHMREICKKDEKTPYDIVMGCDSYFICQGSGSPVKVRCPRQQFFDYDRMNCIDLIDAYDYIVEYCIESSVTVSIPIDLECKGDGDIPEMTGDTLNLNCNQETICDGAFQQIMLCENYFECTKNANGVVEPVKRQCTKGNSFNPYIKGGECMKTPDNLCTARQLAMLRNFRETVKAATNVQ